MPLCSAARAHPSPVWSVVCAQAVILFANAFAIVNHRMLKRCKSHTTLLLIPFVLAADRACVRARVLCPVGLERPDPDSPPSAKNRALALFYGDARHLFQRMFMRTRMCADCTALHCPCPALPLRCRWSSL